VGRVALSVRAADDLAASAEWLRDTAGLPASDRALDRIRLALELLSDWPHMGRSSEIPDARVWPVRRTPYLVYYEPATDGIYVLHVRDARRFEDDAGAPVKTS